MADEVYANGMEVSCKAGQGKSVCAFPDVCFTPPQTPATPPGVPIPYPNTGMDADTSDGSKTVMICGQEAMLKNKSCFKKSTGNEAGSAPKKGVVTSKIQGKVYFTAWSMDVKFEGENVVRHFDLMTHNHASPTPNTPPWPFMKAMTPSKDLCAGDKEKEEEACKEYKPKGTKDVCEETKLDKAPVQKGKRARAMAAQATQRANANACIRARRCKLVPYNGPPDGINGCCKGQTPDHLIPKSSFYKKKFGGKKLDNWPDYDFKKAPCMCLEGPQQTYGNHGLRHAHHKAFGPAKGKSQSMNDAADLAADGGATVSKGCDKDCIKQQLKNGHKGMGSGDVKHSPTGSKMTKTEIDAEVKKIPIIKPTGSR